MRTKSDGNDQCFPPLLLVFDFGRKIALFELSQFFFKNTLWIRLFVRSLIEPGI